MGLRANHVTMMIAMIPQSTRDAPSYRVTFFFGPEAVQDKPDTLFCVFNVKKRSWKAGIQVAVEINNEQLSVLRHKIRLADRLAKSLLVVDPHELPTYQTRIADVFVQAVCRCKLERRLLTGMVQENQRILADDLFVELEHDVSQHSDRLIGSILEELDLAPDHSL